MLYEEIEASAAQVKSPAATTGKKVSAFAREKDDFYVEPASVVRALIRAERPFIGKILDPCCGTGTIPKAFDELRGLKCWGTDIAARWTYALDVMPYESSLLHLKPDSVVSNPPYREAQRFVETALEYTRDRVCVLLPLQFFSSRSRYSFFRDQPLARIWALTPRPKMRPGNVPLKGNGTKEFAWFVFEHGHRGPCMISQLRHCPDECSRKDDFFEEDLPSTPQARTLSLGENT